MRMFIFLLHLSFIYNLYADVSKCQYTNRVPSTTYSSTTCDSGIKYCVTATCPGVNGAIRGCDGDNYPTFCSSTGCHSVNDATTQAFNCTGAANICCCDKDNCNDDSGSNSGGVPFRFYMDTISVLMLILFTILTSF